MGTGNQIAMTKYYYFIDGYDQVFERTEYICDDEAGSHAQYHELSNQEIEWYLAHPGASAHEVKQLCTDQERGWKEIDLAQHKSNLCGMLSKIAESRIAQLIPQGKIDDALLHLSEQDKTPQDGMEQAYADRIRYYRDLRNTARKEMARVRLAIAAATTHQDAENAYNSHHLMDIKTGKEAWNE